MASKEKDEETVPGTGRAYSMKRLLIVLLALSSTAVFGTARASDCSPQNQFNQPPPEYTNGYYAPQALGYTAGTGVYNGTVPPSIPPSITPTRTWVGAYYQDGYWYVDLQNPSAPTVKMFVNYQQKNEHRGLDARIVGGANPSVCIHGRTFGQWPFQESGDGCLLVSSGSADECTFVGGAQTGIQDVQSGPLPAPVCSAIHGATQRCDPTTRDLNTKVDVPVAVTGAYVAVSQRWVIYKQGSTSTTSDIVLSGTAPAAGIFSFVAGVRYWGCLGTVNEALPPASACSGSVAGRGVLFAAHI